VLDKKVYSLKISVSLGSEGGTMEAFGKNLQDTEFYLIYTMSQG
jgi:hypothetical protein